MTEAMTALTALLNYVTGKVPKLVPHDLRDVKLRARRILVGFVLSPGYSRRACWGAQHKSPAVTTGQTCGQGQCQLSLLRAANTQTPPIEASCCTREPSPSC